jgi:hypothetical protein
MDFLLSLRSGFIPKVLNLLVALSGMLSQDDYRRIGLLLWRQCLDSRKPQALAPVSVTLVYLMVSYKLSAGRRAS